jgi:hypothetical protein
MRFRKVYYQVSAMHDGTILFVLPGRKLGSGLRRKPKIDEDGVCKWFLGTWNNFREMDDKNWIAVMTTLANCLNLKRVLRERVQSRLDSLAAQLGQVQQQLDRLECLMGRLAAADNPRTSN